MAIQRALCSTAQDWATTVIREASASVRDACVRARHLQHDYACNYLKDVAKLHLRDGLFEPRREAGEVSDGHRPSRLKASRALHNHIWSKRAEIIASYREHELLLAAAETEQRRWRTGEASLLLTNRGSARELYV